MALALSPSRASDYKQCPLLYRFRAIDRLEEPKTEAMVKGTLVHAVLEELHKMPRQERTYARAVKMIKPQWSHMVNKDPSLEEFTSDDFFFAARDLVKGYFYMENPEGFDAHECEMYVDMTLPNGVPVRGFIDRVDIAPTGEIRIVDYKTGKKPAPQFRESAYFQMKFYALVWWRMFNQVPHQLRLMYLKVVDDLVFSPRFTELQDFERDIEELWSQIMLDVSSGDFQPKKSTLCGWCHFQKYCPEFGGVPPAYPAAVQE